MEKLKKPNPDATKHLRELFQEILERPFSPELINVLNRKPKASKQNKKVAKSKNNADLE